MSEDKNTARAALNDGVAASSLSVASALQAAQRAGIDRLDAQLMLADLLARPRTWLLANDDATLDPVQSLAWTSQLQRLSDGEPLAYLLRKKEFFGLMLQVSPAVLIPRADTETLVEWALELLQADAHKRSSPQVIDLGCGSGAIALALKSAFAAAEMTAIDTSPAALAIAEANGKELGLTIKWQSGDWWNSVGKTRFDLAVSNPPYIELGDPHLQALRHEPELALTSGADGLTALRQIISDAPEHLRSGAWLLLEHGYQQAEAVAALLRERGFDPVQTRKDLPGQPRCTGGRWPGGLAPERDIGPDSR